MGIEYEEYSYIYNCFVYWNVGSKSSSIGLQEILDYGRKDFKTVIKCVTSLKEIFQYKVVSEYSSFTFKNTGTFILYSPFDISQVHFFNQFTSSSLDNNRYDWINQ